MWKVICYLKSNQIKSNQIKNALLHSANYSIKKYMKCLWGVAAFVQSYLVKWMRWFAANSFFCRSLNLQVQLVSMTSFRSLPRAWKNISLETVVLVCLWPCLLFLNALCCWCILPFWSPWLFRGDAEKKIQPDFHVFLSIEFTFTPVERKSSRETVKVTFL